MSFSLFKRLRPQPTPDYPLNWVTPSLAVGHAPMSKAELQSIRQQSVQAIMNLCLEIEDLVAFEREQGFEVYYLPIADEQVPELEDLEQALDWLDEAIYLGKKVLIHCRHGIGRTGTVVYAYLLRKGLGPKRARKVMNGLRSQPTEHSQKRLLRTFGKREGTLTIGEPCLVPEGDTRFQPYLDRLQEVLEWAGDGNSAGTQGADSRECFGLVRVSLVEAVCIQQHLNTGLSSRQREECIQQALIGDAVLQTLSTELEGDKTSNPARSFAHTRASCPLLKGGTCLLFASRPLQCRLTKASPAADSRRLTERVNTLSDQLMADLSGGNAHVAPWFSLCEAVSGKYVQRFFQSLAGR